MPSLYETTAIVGEVSSSNFTTLYNSSGLSAPNSGGGAISGNLNVAGNLTVQGASLLQGAVTLGSTLSLPNYTFPLPDGTTDQVLVTDGSGNLYWTDVSAIPGAAYSIQANTATGGANLTLVDSAGGTDSVKFAGGTNVTVTRTDANTITISTTADDIPNGTAQGQVLTWNGTAWIADNRVTSAASADRFVAEYLDTSTLRSSSAFFRRNYGSTAYANGFPSTIGFQFDSDSQSNITTGIVGAGYDSVNPSIFGAVSTDSFVANRTVVFDFDSTDARLAAGNLILNYDHTGTPTNNVSITVERGSSTDATLTWDESQDRWEFSNALEVQGQITGTSNLDLNGTNITLISGASGTPTQNATITVDRGSSPDATLTWNESTDQWQFSNALTVGGNATVLGNYSQTGESMTINSDNTAADSFLYMKGTGKYLSWNNSLNRFEFNDSLFGSTSNEPPAQFERRVTSAEINTPVETKSALRLTSRVTDAVSNATDQGGPSIIFSRASGTTPGSTEVLYANIAARYYGTTNTADLAFLWSDDNFSEPTPGNFPGTYTLLRLGADDANFFNNSIFIDYETNGATQVGINKNNPAYTLDVNGDANVSGDIYISGVHVNLTTPVQQGQLLFVSDDSPATITNGSLIAWNNNTYRLNFQADNGTYGRALSGAAVTNNTGAVNYTTGDGSGILVGVDSDAQSTAFIGSLNTIYNSSGDHEVRLNTSTNNFASDQATSITGGNTLVFPTAHGFSVGDKLAYSGPTQNGLVYGTTYYVISTGFTTTQCQISLTLGGSAVALTNGTGLSLWFFNGTTRVLAANNTAVELSAPTIVLNAVNTGIPGVNAGITVERGTSSVSDATLIWNETNDRWEVSNDLSAPQASIGNIDISRTAGQIDTNAGLNLTLDSDGGTVLVNDNLNVDSGVLYVDSVSNEVGIGTVTPAYPLDVNGIINTNSGVQCAVITFDGQASLDSNTLTTTSTATVALNATVRNAMTGLINIIQGANVHCVNYTVLRVDSTTALLTTYAEMYNTSVLANFSADVSGGLLRLLITPTSATSTVFSAVRTSLT